MLEYKVIKQIWTEDSLTDTLNELASEGWAIAGTLGGFIILERAKSDG